MEDFTIGLVQLRVGRDKNENLARAAEMIARAVAAGSQWVVLPEMFNCPYELGRFHEFAETVPDGHTATFLAETARRLAVHIVGGSIPEVREGRIYNTATLWSPRGELLCVHRKVHLFDVDIPGGIRFEESAALAAGDGIETTETEHAAVGLAICYDLRFPELFRIQALAGAELLVLPGAFNTTTGPAHWEVLLRARAIENTCYVAACSPAPHPDVPYPAWGHSLVVDPYGEVIASAQREETIITARLEAARLREIRGALPVLVQRRPEVYGRAGGLV